MLIHLHLFDGHTMVSIDPEGELPPLVEALSGSSAFRLTWPDRGERNRQRWTPTDRPPHGSSPPAASPARGDEPVGDNAGADVITRHRLGRYAAMTGAFAGMLIVGMVIGTLRSHPVSGSVLPLFVAPPNSSSAEAPFMPSDSRASSNATDVNAIPPIRLPSFTSQTASAHMETRASRMTIPTPTTSAPVSAPLSPPAAPSAPPMPANPGVLFGLHS